MNKKIFLLFLFLFVLSCTYGQGELIEEQKKTLFRDERSFGISINSDGFGGNFRYGEFIDAYNKKLFYGDISYIRHQKEVKITNSSFDSQKRFVFGKKNLAVIFRGGIGWQKRKFPKLDKGGVEINFFALSGGSFAILKPIYYEVAYRESQLMIVREEKFDINNRNHRDGYIFARSSFLEGFSELKIIPSVFLKAGVNFEFSKKNDDVQALEGGFLMEIFLKKVEIMATEKNNQFFFTLFLSYSFGKILKRYASEEE